MASDDDLRAELARQKEIVSLKDAELAAQAVELAAKDAELAALRARLPSEGVPPS